MSRRRMKPSYSPTMGRRVEWNEVVEVRKAGQPHRPRGYQRLGVKTMISAWLQVVALLLMCETARATDLENLHEFFNSFCWKQTGYLRPGSAKFAPVDEVPTDQRRPGFGKYKLRASGYPQSVFRLRDSEPLTFVTTLDPPGQSESLPRYLWHIIAVPRPGKSWDGLLIDHELPLEARVLSRDDYEFLDRTSAALLTIEGRSPARYLVYNWAVGSNRQLVLDRWLDLFKSELIKYAIETNESYDYQIYYVPVPSEPQKISPGSWLHPSRRRVWGMGVAFGFVVDDTGACIGKDTLEIEP